MSDEKVIGSRIRCSHMDITGDLISAYCSLCLAEMMRTLGCDEVTARFALALHHEFVNGDIDRYE